MPYRELGGQGNPIGSLEVKEVLSGAWRSKKPYRELGGEGSPIGSLEVKEALSGAWR